MASSWQDDPNNPNKTLPLLKMLWHKFHVQPVQYKLITLGVIAITMAWMLVFYTSFVIWQLFCFAMTKTVLKAVEWYLRTDLDKQRQNETKI
jgi:hypothetical protein